MFMPRHFTEDDPRAAVAMARAVGFGHLVVATDEGLSSTPMPFLIDDEGTLARGHLARPNPILHLLPTTALLIVPVSDAYISPSWYPSKAEHGKVVPTWNYEVVHLHGVVVAHEHDWTAQLVRELTDHHEATMPTPWSVGDAPPEYIEGLERAIVGVSLSVTRTDAKRKLSQNKPAAEVIGAADGLEASRRRGAAEIAPAMRQHRPPDDRPSNGS
jgi:transcriptional regulator